MRYVDEFRAKPLVMAAAAKIKKIIPPGQTLRFMEVCGTHTQNFFRFGLHNLLPKNVELIAGPGCPVCVSSQGYIDQAISYARRKDMITLTFGDMLRVPGSVSTLEQERAKGREVRVVYSPLDSLLVARRNPTKKVLFLAVGFETTAPAIALTVRAASEEKLKNLFFFSSLKLIPPAIRYLMRDKNLRLSGFLLPGHVSSIIGTNPYEFIPKRYKISCCVAGFEPLDILEGVYLLVRQIIKKRPAVMNQYIRLVSRRGNLRAQRAISEVFKTCDASWRGLGQIPASGLTLRDRFGGFAIEKLIPAENITEQSTAAKRQCRCGDVLKGLIKPDACLLFNKACSPEDPYGPCMVSHEGTCNAYYRYRRKYAA